MATGLTWAGTTGDDTVNGGGVHFRAVCGQEWGMRAMRHLALAAMVAAGLALAGCGGSSKKSAMPADDGMPPAQPELTPVEKAEAYVAAATAARTAAMEAEKTAKMQRDEAKEKDAYDIYTTGGDSGVVVTNAAAVIAAKAAAEKALADAKQALTDARKALTDLNAVSGTPGLASQKEVVGQRIKDVEAQIKLIEGYLRTINGYAGRVDTEAKIKARADETPAGDAEGGDENRGTYAGARGVLYMLQPFDTASPGGNNNKAKISAQWIRRASNIEDLIGKIPTKVVLPATSDQDNTDDTGRSRAYLKYDLRGLPEDAMTWEQIAGADNLVKKAFGTDNMDVDVLPLAGMPLTVLTSSGGTALTALPAFTGGKADAQYYMGVKGTLHCQGTCSVDGGNLTGKLFFQKAGEEVAETSLYYWMLPTNAHYTPYVAYARYGYWLYETGGDFGIRLFAHAPTGYSGDVTEKAGLAKTATYEGEAFGLSALKTYTAGTHTGQRSGQFTADVTLNATFKVGAAKPKMGGKIDNFMGRAVHEDWLVTLQEKDSGLDDQMSVDGGVAQGAALSGGTAPQAGLWRGETYSQDGVGRPVGAIGSFNAHFSNGHVAGAFATRMKTETAE